MNMKEKLMGLREQAIREAKEQTEHFIQSQKAPTESFFEQAKQRLQNEFNKKPTVPYISISFNPQADKDLDLIKGLYENRLLNEAYLKQLCEQEGIAVQIMDGEQWYPWFDFKINFIDEKIEDKSK